MVKKLKDSVSKLRIYFLKTQLEIKLFFFQKKDLSKNIYNWRINSRAKEKQL